MKHNRSTVARPPHERGIAEVRDLILMHDDDSRRAGAAVPPDDWVPHDPFLSMMNDRFRKGVFGPHPHRGFETVTYIVEGSLIHQDSRGSQGVLSVGDVQWMTAGSGVVHLEDPADEKPVHVLQLWLNLPAAQKMTIPRYQDLQGSKMPIRKEPGAEIRVFSGSSGGVVGPALNYVPVTMADLHLNIGATIKQDLPGSYNGFVHIVAGTGQFGRDRVMGRQEQTLWLERTADVNDTVLTITATTPLHAVLFAGRPLHEPIVAQGPFVMNTKEQIAQAIADYRAGYFGK